MKNLYLIKSSFSVCVYECICVCMCVYIYVCMCMLHTWCSTFVGVRGSLSCQCSLLCLWQFLVCCWVVQDCCLWIFPSPRRSAGITDAQDCVWLSTEFEDPNSGPRACTESSLSTEPSPQAHSHWKTNQNQNNYINNKSLVYNILSLEIHLPRFCSVCGADAWRMFYH